MHLATFSFILLAISSQSFAGTFDDHFTVVFIDSDTEARHGPLPDRRVLARTIGRLADAGAKGIVLKFFLDRERDEGSDDLLAKAFARVPTVLQARIDDHEPSPNELPERFTLPVRAETSITGNSGWLPIPLFAGRARNICFTDYRGQPVPMLETYRGQTVKSLLLCAIELAVGSKAVIEAGSKLSIGEIGIPLDTLNRVPIPTASAHELEYIPLHDILEKDDWTSRVQNRVVILGYDGPAIHKIDTAAGKVSAHRLYVYMLKQLLRDG